MYLRELFSLTKELENDPELDEIFHYASEHYPHIRSKQLAFMKFVQRSLKHSKEDDVLLGKQIKKLDQSIAQLTKEVEQLKQSDHEPEPITNPVTEGKLRPDTYDSLPNLKSHSNLDNSSPYHAYRFGLSLASNPLHDVDTDGPIGQKLVTMGYTSADEEIIKKAEKNFGAKSTNISSDHSIELSDTNTKSPVAARRKNKYGI